MNVDTGDQVVLLPALLIAFLGWAYNILILDRYRGICNFRKIELYALFVALTGGFAGWIGSLSLKHDNMIAIGIVASSFRTFVNWIVLVIIVNEDVFLSRQQFLSLTFKIVITVLWEVQHRLTIMS
tara:strand:+ start:12641 stop:13018 length:378 start_codon:yes stop_codon:yes gene_type:complete